MDSLFSSAGKSCPLSTRSNVVTHAISSAASIAHPLPVASGGRPKVSIATLGVRRANRMRCRLQNLSNATDGIKRTYVRCYFRPTFDPRPSSTTIPRGSATRR